MYNFFNPLINRRGIASKTYYVSNAGNDLLDGLTPATAWQTIDKVNNSTFNPGERILFKKGDTWRETLTVPSSGLSGKNITFSSYGTGDLPIINGADIITGWKDEGGSIGEELIIDSTFDTGNGIVINDAGNIVSGGKLNIMYNTLGYSYWEDVVSVGKTYSYSFDAVVTSGTAILKYHNGSFQTILTVSTSGHKTGSLTIEGTPSGGRIYIIGSADSQLVTIDNFSVKEVTAGYENVWSVNSPNATPSRCTVVVNDTLFTQVSTIDELIAPHLYFIDQVVSPNKLYVYSTTDPSILTSEISCRNYGIYLLDKHNVTISYLDVRNCGTSGIKITSESSIDGYCNIDHINAYRNRVEGICVYDNHNFDRITNCIATSNGFGILGWIADNLTISNCYTTDTIWNRSDNPTYGGWTDGTGFQTYCCNNAIIEHCESFNDPIGIFLDPFDAYNEVVNDAFVMTARYNYIHDAKLGSEQVEGIGVNALSSGGIVNVYYNVIKNCANSDYANISLESNYLGTVNIFNNTVISDGMTSQKCCIFFNHGTNLIIKNNIFYYNAKYVGKEYNCALAAIEDDLFISDHNLFYEINAVDSRFLFRIVTSYTSIATWNAVIGQDIHSKLGNPFFVDIDSDFHLQPDSPCINAGVDVGLTEDYEGNPIIGVPDIGAYEYQP